MNRLISILWDIWCCVSVIGLWPRFIEPKLLKIKKVKISSPAFSNLSGLKILHFSDLHFHKDISKSYVKKVSQSINGLKPDLILFTGDFLCHSKLENKQEIKDFFNSLYAPLGLYGCFGNHDYTHYISRNNEGNYDVKKSHDTHFITKSIKHLFSKKNKQPKITEQAKNCPIHQDLLNILAQTPLTILHNQTIQVPFNSSSLNLTGLGDYWAGKLDPEKAFNTFCTNLPGIILSHNPDSVKFLADSPGNLILSGHTHGGQVNLPFVFKTFIGIENKTFKSGLFNVGNKKLFVTKGVGSHQKFRFFCPPEIALVTLC
jgi:predicted MPP superfamily phosphohydrolase